mgnify:CR=1 FL=1
MKIMSVIALAAVVAGAGTVRAEEVRLDLANEYSASSLVGLADQDFIDRVARLTGGSVVITPHFGGALGIKSKDQFYAVADGAVPLAGTYTGVFTGIDPVFALSSMPFQAPTIAEARKLYEAARPAYEAVFRENGQRLLYSAPYTPTGIWANRPLRDLADFRSLKVRTYDAAGVQAFQQLGAAPIQLSWADTVPALTTGGIDAVLTSDETGISTSLWDQLGYFNAIPYSVAINMTHMNGDVFDRLSDAQKQAVEAAAREAEDAAWRRAAERMATNAQILADRKVTVVQPPAALIAQLQQAGDAVLQGWLREMGERGSAIIAEYRKPAANN